MKLKLIIWVPLFALSVLYAQDPANLQVDTLPTKDNVNHIFLNISIPTGEMYMQSSRICGSSISKLASTDPDVKHEMKVSHDPNGNVVNHFSLQVNEDAQLQAKSVTNQMTQADLGSQVLQLGNINSTDTYRSVFNPDPSASTDVYLDLGIGRSRLDFSDLSLNNVMIQSAFSDVHVNYSLANRVEMEKMEIHAAKAKVVIKNIELARAELVTIMNDMGDTKLILGSDQHSGSTIYLQQGMGDCTLIIHPDHPVKIVLKSGLFTTSHMPDGFKKLDKNTYVNQAYQDANGDQATNVICTIDFGNISVFNGQ